MDDDESPWVNVHEYCIANAELLRKIARLENEQTALLHQHAVLRNQMNVMAAFAQQPLGQHVHHKAQIVQASLRRQTCRKYFITLRTAAVKVQTAYRRHVQQTVWSKTLSTFPERTKAALLLRALNEKKCADDLCETFRTFIAAVSRDIPGAKQIIAKHLEAVPFHIRHVFGPQGLVPVTEHTDEVEEEEEDMGFDLFD